jgi:hypothetical protein
MYPDFPVALDIIPEDRLLVRGWERVTQMVYRNADRIVVLGDSMKRRLASKMEQDSAFSTKKVEGIPNWEDGSFIAPRPKCENPFAQEGGSRVPLRFSIPATSAASANSARPSTPSECSTTGAWATSNS